MDLPSFRVCHPRNRDRPGAISAEVDTRYRLEAYATGRKQMPLYFFEIFPIKSSTENTGAEQA
jgi:hypothetical protein